MEQLPIPPAHLVMPHTAQIVYTSIWAAVVAAFVVYAVVEIVRRRDPLLVVLLVGGAIAYFNEPIDDLLGLVWHPRPGQWVLLDTFGPVPLWGVFVYIALFGGIPYLMYRAFQRGVTARQIWIWIGVFWIADIAVEIPAIASGMYQYYGDPPMKVFGLPLYWFAINIGGPIETAVILLIAGSSFAGWRLLALLPIPMVLDAAGSVGMGWPIFSALHAETSMPVKYAAAFATLAMAFVMLQMTINYAVKRCAPVGGTDATPSPDLAVNR
jgi:hypothetical protein